MGKGIILYKSKYGSTKKYAKWLQEEIGYDCMEIKEANSKLLQGYNTIIFGGGVYASGIAGLSLLKKITENINGKRIAVFFVGASPYDEKIIDQMKKLHFKDWVSNVPLYYCRGAWNEEGMSFKDRTLCKLLQRAVAKQDSNTYEPWQKALMNAKGQDCDWTDKKYLEPVIKFVFNYKGEDRH